MPDEKKLPESADFTVNGRTYPFLRPDKMTFRQQKMLKQLSGGMALAQFDDALSNLDPDAWYALVLVCMNAADPDTPTERHAAILDDLEGGIFGAIGHLVEQAQAAESEGDEGRPTDDASQPGSDA